MFNSIHWHRYDSSKYSRHNFKTLFLYSERSSCLFFHTKAWFYVIYRYVISKWRSIRWVEINQYDITMATLYDITMGNDIARDVHSEITMDNNIARDIHCDVTMSNDIAMSFGLLKYRYTNTTHMFSPDWSNTHLFLLYYLLKTLHFIVYFKTIPSNWSRSVNYIKYSKE